MAGGSHWANIGFPGERDAFFALLDRTANDGDPTVRSDGGRMITWRDVSGATVVLNTTANGDQLVCAHPTFDAQRVVRVRPDSIAADPECSFCDTLLLEVLGPDEQMLHPMAIGVEDLGVARDRIVFGHPMFVCIVLSAEHVEVWPDEQAYLDGQDRKTKFAARAVIPTGMFMPPVGGSDGSPPPEPMVWMAGVLEHAESLTNELTGLPFLHLVVGTYGGSYEVVASPLGLAPRSGGSADAIPVVGSVVAGSFRVIGRLAAEPERRSAG